MRRVSTTASKSVSQAGSKKTVTVRVNNSSMSTSHKASIKTK